MGGASGFGWIAAVLAWMVAVLGQGPILGFEAREVATGLAFAAAVLLLTGWAAERSRPGWRQTAASLSLWVLMVGGLGAAYLHRDRIMEAARSLTQEAGIGIPETVVGQGGEVTLTRRFDGTFAVPARVNDREVRFLFDTGASTVVLSANTARDLGFSTENLRFRVPVATANGRALAAPVLIDRLAVGPIVLRRVSALVAQEGMLEGNLLGQSFLNKLDSYEVRGNRLVLRAAKS